MGRIWIVVFVIMLAACKEVSFPDPQPRGRKSIGRIPQTLQGKYLGIRDDGTLSQDTIVVDANGYRFGYFDAHVTIERDRFDHGVLSDSLQLRSYRGYYFLNFRHKLDQSSIWLLRIISVEKNGDLLYLTPEQEGVDFKDYISRLGIETAVDSFMIDDTKVYQISPSPRELVGLVEKGFYKPTVLKKVR